MKRKSGLKELLSLFSLLLLLMLLFSMPYSVSDSLRGLTSKVLAPFCQTALWAKGGSSKVEKAQQKVYQLELENVQLKEELRKSLEVVVEQRQMLLDLHPESQTALHAFITENEERAAKLVSGLVGSTPADVIYRDPTSWSSFLWINVGEGENRRQERLAIGKDSPVVIGSTLIGVVDYVGESQSRIRLLTDTGLNPAVRVARGKLQNHSLLASIDSLLEKLSVRKDLFPDPSALAGLYHDLQLLRDYLQQATATTYLAKGFVYGSSEPLWRSRKLMLRGEGFNYDFADSFGPARDLMTGKTKETDPPLSLVQEGDLLVTSGLDGLFPSGLTVGSVSHVYPLEDSGISYDLEIIPAIQDSYEISKVYVLPPLRSESFD